MSVAGPTLSTPDVSPPAGRRLSTRARFLHHGNALTGGGRTNVWDSQNRLRECVAGGSTSTYVYGADGIRRRTISATGPTDYVLDNSMMVREMREVNGTPTTYATYLVGPRGPEYRRDANVENPDVRWYCYDGLGSVLAEVTPAGVTTSSRTYDVYGLARSSNGATASKHKFVGSLGHTSEDDTGLVYMRARWVDPAVGRFVSEDPAHQDTNWFAYCGSNPVMYIDESGRTYYTVFLALMVAAGMVAGSSLGYILIVLILRARHKGYVGGNISGGILMTIGASALGILASLLGGPPDDLEKGGVDLAKFAKQVSIALAQKGLGQTGYAFTVGFILGMIIGESTALWEYFSSDYYQSGGQGS